MELFVRHNVEKIVGLPQVPGKDDKERRDAEKVE